MHTKSPHQAVQGNRAEHAGSMFARTPTDVSIYEVALRDGLQNERTMVPLAEKLRLIEALMDAGIRRIEATSFVSAKWIPQLADADDVMNYVQRRDDVVLSALCPNSLGLARALDCKTQEIAVFMSASETHNLKNTNRTIGASLEAFRELIPQARAHGLRVRGYVSTVWGCPYEGAVDPNRGAEIAKTLVHLGCYQVSFGDTVGVGTPRQTEDLLARFLDAIPNEAIALHMHDTRGTALANIIVGLAHGIRHFDASIGGLGGCPYAPGAAGNVATEDLVYMLHGMGVSTGIDAAKLLYASRIAESLVGRALPSKVLQAGAAHR